MKKNPQSLKYNKNFRLTSGTRLVRDSLSYGNIGLVARAEGYLSPEEIEASRRVIVRVFRIYKFYLRKSMLIRVFPFLSLTKKSAGIRMGKGVGRHDRWVYPISKGKVLVELRGLPVFEAKQMLFQVMSKISIRTSIVVDVKGEIND